MKPAFCISTHITTKWADKSKEQILADINSAILSVWEAAEYDEEAMPNHILLPLVPAAVGEDHLAVRRQRRQIGGLLRPGC
mgnify:CR=1 FL=1